MISFIESLSGSSVSKSLGFYVNVKYLFNNILLLLFVLLDIINVWSAEYASERLEVNDPFYLMNAYIH